MRHDKKKENKNDPVFTVTESVGLLDFLLFNLKNKSRNNIKSILTHREILVDGQIVTKHDHILSPGQKVRVIRSPDRSPNGQNMPEIIYEDKDVIVINKPAGLLSISTDKEKELTAYHIMTDYVRQKDPRARIFIVHRLDRDTSGLLMFARDDKLKLAFQNNWTDLAARRGYIAVVEGIPENQSGRIRSWLRETKTLLVYSGSRPGDGLEAVTNYKVIKESESCAMLEIDLETGRKNQIRVHMKEMGNPVAGDKKYGAKTDPLRRLCLHNAVLELKHPYDDKTMCFNAPAPKAFYSLF